MAVDIIARGMAATADSNAEIARKISAPDYDPTEIYNKNDIVFYDGKLYICTGTNVTGAFDPSKWSQIIISDELTAIINRLAQIDNPMLIKGVVATVGDLPANAEPGWVYFVGQTGDTDYDEYVYTEDDGWQHIGSAKIIVDSELSLTSANPVENRVITAALNTKLKSIAAAEAFDPEVTYTTGDYMTLDGELYRCDPNGSEIAVGEDLITTYSSRIKNSTYGYRDNTAWSSYSGGTISYNRAAFYIAGTIPVTSGKAYRIITPAYTPWRAGETAGCIFSSTANANDVQQFVSYSHGGASTVINATSNASYLSLTIFKANEAQYKVYALSAQKFVKTTVADELGEKANASDLTSKQSTYAADSTAWDTTPTENSTKPVTSGGVYTALGAKADLTTFDSMFGTALSHNNIFRGANLTSKYTVAQLYTKVHAGDFSDLYLGDYINVSLSTNLYKKFTGTEFESGVTYYERSGTHPAWTYAATTDTTYDSQKTYYTMSTVTETVAMMIAHFDYFMNVGDSSPITYHHVVLIPRTRLKTASYMNPSHTTVGAYYNSEMHQTILPCYAASFSTALENHVRTWRDRLSTEMTAATPSMAGGGLNGSATAWDWKDTNIRLMNEAQVYGTGIWSSSAYDYGCENRQLAVFRFISLVQYERAYYWLSSVVSSTYFANVSFSGNATDYSAGYALSVRPLIVFG